MIRSAALLVAGLALLGAGPPGSVGGTVEVTVTGVRSDRGTVMVAICDRASFLQPTCVFRGRASAQQGTVLVRVGNVPPGVYAVQAYQDENGNGRVDRTLLGIPKEGIGFSRDAPMRFGPPRFDDAAVTLAGDTAIAIALRYFD